MVIIMNNFEAIIGIENHIELNTKTKMFSSGAVSYKSLPNSMVNFMDIGYPGIMPTVNKKGIELALIACKVLNLTIDPIIQFDRKNYYYPDLPKGFQITQKYFPIGKNGYLNIMDENNNYFKVEIERLHIEEDTAKQLHKKNKTLLDYNRSGIGLIEIVTRPMLFTLFQIRQYLETLRNILIYTKIINVNTNDSLLRCDINISLRLIGSKKLGKKVELKNINSIINIENAIKYEIKRQKKLLLLGKIIQQQTRRFDEKTKKTILLRNKTDEIDYKYFSEPNIFPIKLNKNWIKNIINNIPELPTVKQERYLFKYNLKPSEIKIILQNYDLMTFFESTIKLLPNFNYIKIISNYLVEDISCYLNQKKIKITETKLTPQNLIKMVFLIKNNIISNKQAKIILKEILNKNCSPIKIISKLKIKQINNPIKIQMIIEPFFNSNLEILEQYEKRPKRVINFFMGELMKLTKGQVSPKIGKQIIIKLIIEKQKK